ncbi:MAG: MFS transporter [Firmicutes bacterium]|nr:MFS transporter [Bacillota bacterium]
MSRTFAALRHPHFRAMWIALLLSNTGTWMQTVSQGWLVYQLTDSQVYLGSVGLVRALPLLTLSLVGGAAADRFDRRRLLYVTNTAAAVLSLLLAVLTWTGTVRVWHILAIGLLSAAVLSFDQPTRQAFIPTLVPRELLMNAISLNSMTFNGAAVFGPALAGALVPWIGLGGNFFLNALSYAAVPLALWRMKLPPQPERAPRRVADDLREGLRYVRGRPDLLALLAAAAGLSFFARSYVALLPVFARDILKAGVQGLGLLMAAPGLGTVLGALLLAHLGDFRAKEKLLLGSGLGLCGALVAFAFSRSFTASLGLQVVAGAASVVASSVINTLLQLSVDDAMRGRVMSMYTLTMLGMLPLGQMPLGALGEAWGAPWAVTLFACVAAGVLVGALSASARRAGARRAPAA